MPGGYAWADLWRPAERFVQTAPGRHPLALGTRAEIPLGSSWPSHILSCRNTHNELKLAEPEHSCLRAPDDNENIGRDDWI